MAQNRGKGNYIVNTFNGMAYGFFASLIIGTILKQLGSLIHVSELVTWGTIAGYLMGPAIGVGIGYAIEAKGLNLITAIIAGAIGAGTFQNGVIQAGNPISAYVAVLAAIEMTRLIEGKTPVDILLVPFVILIQYLLTLGFSLVETPKVFSAMFFSYVPNVYSVLFKIPFQALEATEKSSV